MKEISRNTSPARSRKSPDKTRGGKEMQDTRRVKRNDKKQIRDTTGKENLAGRMKSNGEKTRVTKNHRKAFN